MKNETADDADMRRLLMKNRCKEAVGDNLVARRMNIFICVHPRNLRLKHKS
jgi:hypothetical protein